MSMFVRFMKRLARQILRPVLRFKKIEMRSNESSRKALRDLVAKVGRDNLTMVEVGSYRGESAEVFLSSGKVSKIYCVDPWEMYYDADDGAAFTDMKKVEADFDRRHKDDPRVIKVKGTIDTFAEQFAGKVNVDLVYIDGLHTYEGVKHDIEIARTKIKPAVAIAGHDYNPGSWDGSARAVREAFSAPDAVFSDTSWLKLLV